MKGKNVGSSIDDFLKKEGTFEEAQSLAIKEVVAWQSAEAMKKQPRERGMCWEIVEAKALEGHRIHLRFRDGAEGTVEFKAVAPFKGVFAELQDQKVFEKMRLNPELGTVQWENGADLAPEVLHDLVTGLVF